MIPRVELQSQEVALQSDGQTGVPGVPPDLLPSLKYVNIRSTNQRNIQISCSLGVWATLKGVCMEILTKLHKEGILLLIFSSTETKNFYGYGIVTGGPDARLHPGCWGQFSSRLGPNWKVQWLKQCEVP